jgi:hypothetical protein
MTKGDSRAWSKATLSSGAAACASRVVNLGSPRRFSTNIYPDLAKGELILQGSRGPYPNASTNGGYPTTPSGELAEGMPHFPSTVELWFASSLTAGHKLEDRLRPAANPKTLADVASGLSKKRVLVQFRCNPAGRGLLTGCASNGSKSCRLDKPSNRSGAPPGTGV